MTHTSTKTAVAWMLVGGIASLAASMALGLPWDRTRLDSGQRINKETSVSNINNFNTSKPAWWICSYYTTEEGVKIEKQTKPKRVDGDGSKDKKYCKDIIGGHKIEFEDEDGTKKSENLPK